MADRRIGRYCANLRRDVQNEALYRALASIESDPRQARVYGRLAAVEQAHAEYWRRRLHELDADAAPPRPGLRVAALIWLARRFGPGFVLPSINRIESQGDHPPEMDPPGLQRLEEPPRGRARRFQGRHRAADGNALRAAVLGANDGLVSNLSLVMGVAGADVSDRTILVTGLAGLVAGACSMAMGEWLSVNSSREYYRTQIELEKRELMAAPAEERAELEQIYLSRGLDEGEARELADRLMRDPGAALDALVREGLGIDPEQLGGSAWVAAASSFCLFALGAIFPVAPYFLLGGIEAVAASLAAGALALMAIGAGTSLFTGRSIGFSALRQLAIGFAAAGITYGIGRLVGVSIGG